MDINNAVVFHKVFGRGVVSSVSDKLVFVVFDSIPGETKKFQYPLCFESTLHFENHDLENDIQSNIKIKKAENELLEKEDQEEQKRGIVQSEARPILSQRRSIQS